MKGHKLVGSTTTVAGRFGQSSSTVEKKIYFFGGNGTKHYNDINIYHSDVNVWEKEDRSSGVKPSPRYGHSASVKSEQLWFFGGCENGKYFNDIHTFDTSNFTWAKVVPQSEKKLAPEARASHSAILFRDRIVVFGGVGSNRKYFNNIYEFSTTTLQWSQPKIFGAHPPPRAGHVSWVYGSQMFVFGGSDGKDYFNDIWILDLENWQWMTPKIHGKSPIERAGHTAALVGNHAYIIGGCTSSTQFLNDIHVLNLDTYEWQNNLHVSGTHFSPRYRHSSATIVENDSVKILIFGGTSSGILYNDLHELQVTQPKAQEENNATELVNNKEVLLQQYLYEHERVLRLESKVQEEEALNRKLKEENSTLQEELKSENKKRKKSQKERKVLQESLKKATEDVQLTKEELQLSKEKLYQAEQKCETYSILIEDNTKTLNSIQTELEHHRQLKLIIENDLVQQRKGNECIINSLRSQLEEIERSKRGLQEQVVALENVNKTIFAQLQQEVSSRTLLQKQYTDLKMNKLKNNRDIIPDSPSKDNRSTKKVIEEFDIGMSIQAPIAVASVGIGMPPAELSPEKFKELDLMPYSKPSTPSGSKKEPFEDTNSLNQSDLVKKYRSLFSDLSSKTETQLRGNTPINVIQEEITDSLVSMMKEFCESAHLTLGKPPCLYSIFIGGSVGRGEASLHSDIEYGIVIERKDIPIDYFHKFSQHVANLLEEVGTECDENFSPPHLSPVKQESSKKDWRGFYFYPNENSKVLEKRGSTMLVDTPENFSNWQVLNSKVSGSAVLAAILREGRFVFGTFDLYAKFSQLSFEKWSNSTESRREFFKIALSSLRQFITKLPNPKHLDNALYMNEFPLMYDLKDILKCLYLMVTAFSMVYSIRETNSFKRLDIIKEKITSNENMVHQLNHYVEFIYKIRLISQLHYKNSYHKVLGMQVLESELKKYKDKFIEHEPNVVTRSNIEWYNKILLDTKAQLLDNKTISDLPPKIIKKITKLWLTLFGTPLDVVSENTMNQIENKLKEMETNLDKNKYFLAKDKQATNVKSKPLTINDVEHLKKRLQKLKDSMRELFNDFYDPTDTQRPQTPSSDPQIRALEEDVRTLSLNIPTIKAAIETDPFILSSSQVLTLHDCIDFIKNSLSTMQSLAF